jgi:enoyl-CoA hydratase
MAAVAKAKAMGLCLTARFMDAAEAEESGLVARVIPAGQLLEKTLMLTISKSLGIVG